MSKNKVTDISVEGRVHDGYHYLVSIVGQGEVRLADSRPIGSLWAAIKSAQKAPIDSDAHDVTFSGAREMEDEEDEETGEPTGRQILGKLDGSGVYPAATVRGLRYAGQLAGFAREAAYEAAQAIMEAQERAAEDALAFAGQQGEEPVENGTLVIPAPGQAPMAGADEDADEDEVG